VGFVKREEVDNGVPDEAFAKLPGDDADIGREIRARNKRERTERNQGKLSFTPTRENEIKAVMERWSAITAMPERTPADIEAKKRAFEEFSGSGAARLLTQLASIPIAQFYLPRTEDNHTKLTTDGEFRDVWAGNASLREKALTAALTVAGRKRFFHWFIEFPEILQRGGFDCILGNPPYLGGQALSGTYGHEFCAYVRSAYAPTGLSDLIVYFIRRIYALLRPGGFTAFITTNSIKDGDVRKDGLEQVVAQGGSINFAVRGIKWPGQANLVVSLVGIHHGAWQGKHVLDSQEVDTINTFFEAEAAGKEPVDLTENAAMMFQGSIFLGDGFLLTHAQAAELVRQNPTNSEVIQPIINGQELNNEPDQKPGRSIINFRDWPESRARGYVEPFEIVESIVKPERLRQGDATGRGYWWRFLRPRNELYQNIARKKHCFVAARTTKHLSFSASPVDRVFSDALYVLTTDRWDLFSIVQSSVHEVWARKYSGALKTHLRYSPSECFDTFAFPGQLWPIPSPALAAIGELYHKHRRSLMLGLWLGLTDIYNLFHSKELEADLKKHYAARAKKDPHGLVIPEEHRATALKFTYEQALSGILELRRLHMDLDNAVLAAYGWHEQSEDGAPSVLAHDFYEVDTLPENDRIRFTIAPVARKELLARLLKENHRRAAAEAATAPFGAEKLTRKSRKQKTDKADAGPLFG
jgi:hypothetical protein